MSNPTSSLGQGLCVLPPDALPANLTMAEAAAVCRCTRRTLDRYRKSDLAFPKAFSLGTGPSARKFVKRDEILAWRDRNHAVAA